MTYHNSKRSRPRPASDANASNRAAWLKFQSQMERGQQEPLQVWEDEGGSLIIPTEESVTTAFSPERGPYRAPRRRHPLPMWVSML